MTNKHVGIGKFPGRGVARHAWTDAFGGFGCIHGTDFTEPYPKHVHARLVVAVIESGSFQLITRDCTWHAQPGDVVVINAFRVHGEWWNRSSFRAMYLSGENLRAASSARAPATLEPWFERPILSDPELARQVRGVHDAVQDSDSETTIESRTISLLAMLRDCSWPDALRPVPAAIAAARDLLHADPATVPTIAELSRLAGWSAFHFIRTFHRTIGLPPHAYFDQLRVARAKEYLVQGRSLSDTARSLGYCDQSHFTRSFRRSALVTPGHYLNMVRGASSAG